MVPSNHSSEEREREEDLRNDKPKYTCTHIAPYFVSQPVNDPNALMSSTMRDTKNRLTILQMKTVFTYKLCQSRQVCQRGRMKICHWYTSSWLVG